ncbi:MAG: phosphohistidine phosphatase SixA [Planctomycetota bacterium]|jgi:phosphohistidine phosphatase
MELYLVRHGQAAAKVDEPGRPLTEPGAEVVEQVAVFAARTGIRVDEIRHSEKLRARQTAEILAESLQPPRGVNAVAGLNPEDDVHAMAETLEGEDGCLMLVGHLPFLGRLTGLLVAGDTATPIVRFRTACIVRLVREQGSWSIDWVVTPDSARQAV